MTPSLDFNGRWRYVAATEHLDTDGRDGTGCDWLGPPLSATIGLFPMQPPLFFINRENTECYVIPTEVLDELHSYRALLVAAGLGFFSGDER